MDSGQPAKEAVLMALVLLIKAVTKLIKTLDEGLQQDLNR
jgi:hypothetical protein